MKMKMKMRAPAMATLAILLLLLMASDSGTVAACPSYDNGKDCSRCISDRFKSSCPGCVPIMRCMARCLWGGISRARCTKKCDCNSDYPKLVDCKKCLSHCKCTCSSA